MLHLRLRWEDDLPVPREDKEAMTREEEKETGKDSDGNEDEQGKEDEGTDDSSKGLKDETNSPMKPTAGLEPEPKKHSKANCNEGMEGTADEETQFPHKVEESRREPSPEGAQQKGPRLIIPRPNRPVQGQEQQGTLVPRARKSVRFWSPGCLFPWA